MSLTSQQNIIDAVYAKIKNSIGDLVNDSIYENEAPQDTDLPMCVFNIVADVPVYDMNKESLDCDIQVFIFGWKKNGSKAVRTILSTLIESIDRNEINITGYDNEIVFISNRGVISIEDDIIEIRLEFNLKGF